MIGLSCISLWQPWASFISYLLKEYETRHWSTPYRGAIVIHAAKAKDSLLLCKQEPYVSILARAGLTAAELPFGAAVCLADLTDCIRMDDAFIARQSRRELALGNWKPGRYAWKLENIRVAVRPLPMSGKQGIYRSTLVREDFAAIV